MLSCRRNSGRVESDDAPKKTPARGEAARRYRAFICYSQRDKAAADKLHRLLEAWRAPLGVAGKAGRWAAIPEKLSPVFRDREELGFCRSRLPARDGPWSGTVSAAIPG